jgi:hypothetical protein
MCWCLEARFAGPKVEARRQHLHQLEVCPLKNIAVKTAEPHSLRACPPIDHGVAETAWTAEIERRVHAHERGEGELFEVEAVMAEAEKIAPPLSAS